MFLDTIPWRACCSVRGFRGVVFTSVFLEVIVVSDSGE